MNRFTLQIKSKGWTVTEACEYWHIHYDTYARRCNNLKFKNQLQCMIDGLQDRRVYED